MSTVQPSDKKEDEKNDGNEMICGHHRMMGGKNDNNYM